MTIVRAELGSSVFVPLSKLKNEARTETISPRAGASEDIQWDSSSQPGSAVIV